MDVDELSKKLFGDEEPQKPAFDPEKIRLIVERILLRNNLTLKSIDATEEGDYLAKSTDTGGSRIFSFVRLESSEKGIERGSLEDFFREALEKNSDRHIFITDSVFTEEAQTFAAEKYIILVDGEKIESILAEKKELEIEKAFISAKSDREALQYFKTRRKKKTFRVIGTEEKIEEIDRRYSPVACYMVSYAGEEVVEKTRVYVDLAYGELYRVVEGRVEKNDIIRRIMSLPESARELLLELLHHEKIDEEHISGKDLELLKKRKFVKIKRKEKSSGILILIIDEILDAVRLISRGASEFGGKSSQAETIYRDPLKTKTQNIASPDVIEKFDHTYDLEFYLLTSKPKDEFDHDDIKYDKDEVARILNALTEEEEEIEYRYQVYAPYYKCTYLGRDRYRYLRHTPLKFKKKKARVFGGTSGAVIMFASGLPLIMATILLVGLISTFITKESLSWIFTGNKFMDSLVASVFGTILLGDPIAAYIIGDELLNLGVSLVAVTSFLVAWVSVGVVHLPIETRFFGTRFTLLRAALSFILAIAVAFVTVSILGV